MPYDPDIDAYAPPDMSNDPNREAGNPPDALWAEIGENEVLPASAARMPGRPNAVGDPVPVAWPLFPV